MHRRLAETIKSFEHGIKVSRRPEDRQIARDYLAALASVLASTVLGDDILSVIRAIDRLFGQTWITDADPFQQAFANWDAFKDEYRRFVFSGMTVNERLYANGTLEAFDDAKATKDVEQMEQLLGDVHVDDTSIKKIIETT
jgi:hypothetical protein